MTPSRLVGVCMYECRSNILISAALEKECIGFEGASVIVARERGHPMDTTGAKASKERAVTGWH